MDSAQPGSDATSIVRLSLKGIDNIDTAAVTATSRSTPSPPHGHSDGASFDFDFSEHSLRTSIVIGRYVYSIV